jgi:hypothetical protein
MLIDHRVPDRTKDGEFVFLKRYVINKGDAPTAIIFGKFAPWTGGTLEHGHGRLIKKAQELGIHNFYVVSPYRNEDEHSTFNTKQKDEIINRSLKSVPGYQGIIRSHKDLKNILAIFRSLIVDHSIQRPVFVVGPDREKDFSKFFIPFKIDNPAIIDSEDESFGKGEYVTITGERETSATKLRQALVNNNMAEFQKLSGHSEEMFKLMRQMMGSSFRNLYEAVLTEGGNLKIGTAAATKIELSKYSEEEIETLKSDIKEALIEFSKGLAKKNEGWSRYSNLLENNSVFSGSSKLFFEKSLEEFKRFKPRVGDIDIQFPIELQDSLEEFCEASKKKTFGKFTFIGQGGKSPIQINTLFRYPKLKLNVQVDFEPVDFKDGSPSEFSKFSRSSSWEDVQNNIKGVFQKYLLRSLVGRNKISNISVVTSFNPKTSLWRVSKKDYEGVNERGFSVDRGVRIKFVRAINKDGKEFFVDKIGNEHLEQKPGTKPAYQETDTKTYDYLKDVKKIAELSFGKSLTSKEMTLFGSFVGCLSLMKKYLSVDENTEIRKSFFDLIFGDSAQEIEQGKFVNGINENDFSTKFAAYSKLVNTVFGEKVSSLKDLPSDEKRDIIKYYKNLSERK